MAMATDVSLDENALNALECPICSSPFVGSIIFQCMNGHAVCQDCHDQILGTENPNCPTCSMAPIGEIRCRPLETVIDGMVFPCAFVRDGCTRRLSYAERQVHEVLCPNGPCECPFPGCRYSALLLNDHIREAHAAVEHGDAVVSFAGSSAITSSARVTLDRTTEFRVLLQLDGCVFLLLNGGDVPVGRSLSVVSLGRNQVLQYKLEVSGGRVPGKLSLLALGSVPCVRRFTGQHPTDEGFLLVPDAYWSTSDSVSVTVHVQNSTPYKAVCAERQVHTIRQQETREFLLWFFLFSVIAVVLCTLAFMR